MAKGSTAASVLGLTKERIVKVRIIKKWSELITMLVCIVLIRMYKLKPGLNLRFLCFVPKRVVTVPGCIKRR